MSDYQCPRCLRSLSELPGKQCVECDCADAMEDEQDDREADELIREYVMVTG